MCLSGWCHNTHRDAYLPGNKHAPLVRWDALRWLWSQSGKSEYQTGPMLALDCWIGLRVRLLPRGGYVNDDDHSIGGGARNGTETIQNQLLARAVITFDLHV